MAHVSMDHSGHYSTIISMMSWLKLTFFGMNISIVLIDRYIDIDR